MSARLTSVAPDLVSRLRSCSEDELRAVVGGVTREAVARSGLDDPALSSLVGEPGAGDREVSAVRALVAQLDEEAWTIQESEGEDGPRYLAAFRQARAASAVGFSLETGGESALESIYEAYAALGSIDEVRQLVESRLHSEP